MYEPKERTEAGHSLGRYRPDTRPHRSSKRMDTMNTSIVEYQQDTVGDLPDGHSYPSTPLTATDLTLILTIALLLAAAITMFRKTKK